MDFIDEIHDCKEFRNKAEGIKYLLKKKRIKPHEAICVGDRDTDIIAAKKAHCLSVAVSNKISWSSNKDLIKAKPDFIIKDFKELPRVIKKFND